MYPKNSFVERNDHRKKVIETLGVLRFLSHSEGRHPNWEDRVESFFTEDELKRAGWVETLE